jgi:non-specific serine/threonine protein kinase/serine/threonine-protein kinase
MPTIAWEQVREVLDAVLDLPSAERTRYLDEACPEPSVRRYIESLMLSYEQAGSFLEQPAVISDVGSPSEKGADSWVGRRIGAYQIVEQIGEGGMGEVYRAVRADDQYQNQVAIKLVRGGFDLQFTRARFRTERQILANLDHSNITRLLDGGATEEGQPYLVMEYIQGLPLDDYCDRRKLTVTERLKLFRTICGAVQYAHQNLVIHRDLKPSNILVREDGTPKLLDFGIAKLLDESVGAGAVRTVTTVRLLTPEYASPEQLLGEAITTASDVYSLGAVLYELLTGHRTHRLISRQPDQVAKAVAEAEPDKPSTVITRVEESPGLGEPRQLTPESVSAVREGSVEKLRRRLAGDLDNIVLMALRTEPQRRYASVEQFSEDIRRHLEGLPVLARTDTFAYRSGKFIRRHRTGAAAAALVVLSLISGLAIALREAHVARVQRANAERRFNDVRRLANSLIYDIHDSIRDLPGSTAARKLIVQRALEYLDSLNQEARGDLSLQRELANAYERVGDVQGKPQSANLGDSAGALASYLKAHAIRQAVADRGAVLDRVSYAANCRALAYLQFYGSDAAASVKTAQQALAVSQALASIDPSNAQVLQELASDYQALADILTSAASAPAHTDIEGSYQKALEIDEKLAAASSDPHQMRRVEAAEFFIARRLRDTGFETQAVEGFHKALAISEKLAGDSNNTQALRDLASVHNNLGDALLMSGATAEALESYRKALEEMEMLAAVDRNDEESRMTVGEAALNVGTALAMLGKSAEAIKYLRRCIDVFENAVAREPRHEGANYDLALAYVWRASVLSALSDPGAALEDYHKALAIQQRLGNLDPGNTYWRESSAAIYAKTGDFFRGRADPGAAAENYRRAVTISQELLGADSSKPEPLYVLAAAYFGFGELSSERAAQSSQRSQRVAGLTEAKSWYQQSADAWRHIARPAAVSPDGFAWGDSKQVSVALVRCRAALDELQGPSVTSRAR